MQRKVTVILTLLCALAPLAAAADNDLERQLMSQYGDKVLALRHSYRSSSQEYAIDGAPLTAGEEGPWTLYGRMLVKEVSVTAESLILEGKRAQCFFDKKGTLTQFQEDRKHPAESLKITLRLQQPLSSADEATAALSRVFALTPEEIVRSAPAYWQAPLAKEFGIPDVKKPDTQDVKKPDAQDAGRQPEKGNAQSGNASPSVVLGAPHVSAPQILYQPEPGFTDAARARRFEGVVGLNIVVDPTGKVRNVKIIRPLGMGLDENAVATVSTWRFNPATKDGQPVAVAVYVEVAFHLR